MSFFNSSFQIADAINSVLCAYIRLVKTSNLWNMNAQNNLKLRFSAIITCSCRKPKPEETVQDSGHSSHRHHNCGGHGLCAGFPLPSQANTWHYQGVFQSWTCVTKFWCHNISDRRESSLFLNFQSAHFKIIALIFIHRFTILALHFKMELLYNFSHQDV